MRAEADRVVIRPARSLDAAAFLAAMRTSRDLHGRWLTAPRDASEFEQMLARGAEGRFVSMLVCLRGDGAIAGYFNLSEIVRGAFQNAYLGYGAVAEHAGRGYMGEGLQLLIAHAFGELALHRLEANIQPGNEASIALVRRAGFTREGYSERYLKIGGRWRDHERWALRAEQWRPRIRRAP